MPYPSPNQVIGVPFIELQTVDSTNNYALARVHAGLAEHGLSIFAHDQVAGKGQRGKEWKSIKGNIALSIVIKPTSLALMRQFELSACAAVALQAFFSKYAGDATRIKWPNDLYWKDRKAGGILIESVIKTDKSASARWEWAVIGMGININQVTFHNDLLNPVSLKQITGKDYDPVLLAHELCASVDYYFSQLASEGFQGIMALYLSQLYKIGEQVKFRKGNRLFEARVQGVSPEGKLMVHHVIDEQFELGEVQWVL